MNINNSTPMTIMAPVSGKVISIEKVNDPVFARKLVGDGIAIIPDTETIYSPIEGKITMIVKSKHAIGIQSKEGIDILIHIGIDTVRLDGQGFDLLVEDGQLVNTKTPLLHFDNNFMRNKNIDTTIIVLITNHSDYNLSYMNVENTVSIDSPILSIIRKPCSS